VDRRQLLLRLRVLRKERVLAVHSGLGAGAGCAPATGAMIAADPKASRPPANMPNSPRRTIVTVEVMKNHSFCSDQVCDHSVAPEA
jgi:hypothetical protein